MSRTRTALLVAAAGLALTAPLPAAASTTSTAGVTGVPAIGSPPHPPVVPNPAQGLSAVTGATAPRQAPAAAPRQGGGQALVGVFRITSGQCGSGKPSGSYFSMLDPSGSPVTNSDSPCSDKSATPLQAGSTGLSTEAFEPFGSNPAAASTIVRPASFFGSPFTVATQNPDKQTSQSVSVPSVTDNGGTLTGQLEAFQVFYNSAYYNQGSPKPGGGHPGSTTTTATGQYDASTGHYTLDWKSTIVGGAFNNFTGVWHLEGTFAAGSSTSSAGSGSGGASSGGTSAAAGSSSGGTSGATAGAATSSSGSLAMTGPTFSPWLPLALLLMAVALTIVRRRGHADTGAAGREA